MSSEITSTVWGMAPSSEKLLAISNADNPDGVDPVKFSNQLVEDYMVWADVLREARIDYASRDWGGSEDYFREIVEGAGGFGRATDEAPATHWFGTNILYHRPIIEGPRTKPNNWHTLIPAEDQPTVISPYTFAKLAELGTGVDEATALKRVIGVYDERLGKASLQDRVRRILFYEPYAASEQVDESERRKLRQTVGGLAANHPRLKIGIYFSFGNAAELVSDFAEDERVAAIGCDLLRTPIDSLPELPEHRFLAGLVDGESTLMQDDQEIKNNLEKVLEKTKGPKISLTHSNELMLVPRTTAFEKILQIGRVAHSMG